MADKIENIYELRPLIEQIPESWRDRIEEIGERYKKLYTALIYDVMAEVYHLPGRSLKPGIGPLQRGGVNGKVAGPAFTSRRCTTPNMDPKVHNIRLGLMASMCQGCVYVSDVQGNRNCGQFGEITATAMRAAGCTGAVIDGSTRDSNYLINMGFPTFCRFRNPVEGLGRSMIVDYQIPIYVNGIDGMIKVEPGDFIFGDNDGVVIVPKDKTIEVLEIAETWFENEKASRKAMADGMDPFEVYNTYGRF